MAGTVQRLIRHVWGFVSSPANIENKQQSFNEGDNGSGRDRTQLVSKGPTGISHTWITIDEIEDYVQSEINISSISKDNVFIKVTTVQEYITAMELEFPALIYCDDGSGYGLKTEVATIDASVTANKTIYGAGGVSIYLSGDTNKLSITYDDDNVSVKFIDDIVLNVDYGGPVDIGAFDGGNTRTNCKMYASVIRDDFNDTGSLPSNAFFTFASHCDVKCVYEQNRTTFTNIKQIYDNENYLWSGLVDRAWANKYESTTESKSNTTLKSNDNFRPTVTEETNGTSVLDPFYQKTVKRSNGTGNILFEISKDETFDVRYDGESRAGKFKKSLRDISGVFRECFNINGDGQLTIGDQGEEPWYFRYNIVKTGHITLFSYIDDVEGNTISGIADNCYFDGTDWIFSNTGNYARVEKIIGGKKEKLISTVFGTAGNTITFENVEDYEIHENSLASVPTGSTGEIVGLKLSPNDKGTFQVTFKCNVSLIMFEGSSAPRLKIGIYKNSTLIDDVEAYFSLGSSSGTMHTTLSTTLISSVDGPLNSFKFRIDTTVGSPIMTDAKTTAIQIK